MLIIDQMLPKITFVLHKTRSADNVGGAARAMANMGLSRLVIAEPAAWDRTQAQRVATSSSRLIEHAVYEPDLHTVIDRMTLCIATSARARKNVRSISPEEAAIVVVDEAMRGGSPAILFGDEKNGLPARVFDRSFAVSSISTNHEAPSLNLAQSVLIHAYAIKMHHKIICLKQQSTGSATGESREKIPDEVQDDMAENLSRLRERGRALLLYCGYLNRQKPDRIMGELERLLLRAKPTDREIILLLGLIRQMEWAVGQNKP